jgi:carboxylate-amine ligase
MIEALMEQGGQARWLTAHMAAGAGMNDLSRVASEIFENPLGAAPARTHDSASGDLS